MNIPMLKQGVEGLERDFFISVALSIIFAAWLCLLVWRRDLWLRYTAAEAAFYMRLRLPAKYIQWRRKFAEGRAEVRLVAWMFVGCLILSVISGCFYVHYNAMLVKNQ
jgi:hypothetical protein